VPTKRPIERIKETISSGINSISDVEFTPTKELGKVHKELHHWGLQTFPIRGMWHIANPNKIFDYILN